MGLPREILVTGATGFVGHHVAKKLIERGCEIKVLSRPNSRRDNLDALPRGRYEVVEGDLTDAESLKSAMRGVRTLYHVAADYRLWSRDPKQLYRANVEGTRTLLQIATDSGVEQIGRAHV